ncbi:hypothetical protein [Paenibacillus sp. R14(2021)]|uniref:hypothetical protein n=1 Tax=Paenibacillus sp. R14(2021) TaxID=2859228 RepID=UPI001C611A13|nr:hypothetical protein [Paenibacillus sp. R14(2021)]
MHGSAAGVLTQTDIRNIRHYVQHKYGDLPTERRAEIVADAMQRIVIRQLPEFPMEQKQQITSALLRKIAASQGVPVSDRHIFEACMQLDVENPALFGALHRWTEQRLGVSIPIEAFREVVREGVHIAMHPRIGVEAWDAAVGAAGFVTRESTSSDSTTFRQAEAAALPTHKPIQRNGLFFALSLLLISTIVGYAWWVLRPVAGQGAVKSAAVRPFHPEMIKPAVLNELPDELRYIEVDRSKLVRYLTAKSSLLAEEPYLSAIIGAAKKHNIHPLLLFAITGQEQAFVPKTAKNARKIANNPFNVYYSWQDYNTTIEESANIAGKTINHLSFERPNDVDALEWINRKYAEDDNWSNGVSRILKAMIAQIMTDK